MIIALIANLAILDC